MNTFIINIEALDAQHNKIFDYLNMINNNILNNHQKCDSLNGMLNQLELLCQFHFMEEERLMEEIASPSAAKHKHLNDMFLAAIDRFKIENNQCHSPSVLSDFKKLRDDLVSHMQNETLVHNNLFNCSVLEDSTAKAY